MQDAYAVGRFGEEMIRAGLQRKGWYVIPTSHIVDGGAPVARQQSPMCSDAIIIPDLHIAKSGHGKWAEVKTKTRPGYMRNAQEYRHGFCSRQWDHYWRMQREYGISVWLFVWERLDHYVLFAPLTYMGQPVSRSAAHPKFCKHGLVFFSRHIFHETTAETFLRGDWNDAWLEKFFGISPMRVSPASPVSSVQQTLF